MGTQYERAENGIHYKRKRKKFVTLPKPKYAEEYSLEENAAFQPWKVVLKIELDPLDPEPVAYDIFVRAKSPQDAMYAAYYTFSIWNRTDNMSDYPRVCTCDSMINPESMEEDRKSYAYPLSEDQWRAFWIEAQMYDPAYVGDRRNPSMFRFSKPGWNARGGKVWDPRFRSILVPPTAAEAKTIQKKMEAIDASHKKKFGK